MKRIISLVLAVILMFSVFGCGKAGDNLKVENGILSWEAKEEAVSYEVNLGDDTQSVTEASIDLTTALKESGEYEVKVSAVYADGERKEIGSISVNATALEKMRIGVQGTGTDMSFVLNSVEGAASYSYQLDGEAPIEIEIEEGSTYLIPITGTSQTISVYAKGVSEGTNIVCSSESTYAYAR